MIKAKQHVFVKKHNKKTLKEKYLHQRGRGPTNNPFALPK